MQTWKAIFVKWCSIHCKQLWTTYENGMGQTHREEERHNENSYTCTYVSSLKSLYDGAWGRGRGDIKKKSPITHKTFQIFFHIHVKTQFLKENLQIPAVFVCSQSLFVIVRKSSIVYDKNSSSWVWFHSVALENASFTIKQ